VEHRLQDGDDAVLGQHVDQGVEVLEVLGDELVDVPGGQVAEGDAEPLVQGAVLGPDGTHVRLHAHQQHRVEALCAPVSRVDAGLLNGRPPRQGPRGVGDEERRTAVGVDEVAAVRGHPPEAVPLEHTLRDGLLDDDLPGLPVQAGVGGRARGPPRPATVRQRGRKPHAPGAVAVVEGRPAQLRTGFVGEVRPHLDVGVRVAVGARRRQHGLDLPPWTGSDLHTLPFQPLMDPAVRPDTM
jgi:hypothetical protein